MNPAHPADDRTDLAALQRGEDDALNRIIGRWERPLFAFAWRYLREREDARDLVAETFVRLYQQRARLQPDGRLAAWLFTTLTNLCHNQHRWRRRHPAASLESAEAEEAGAAEIAGGPPDAREALEHEETLRALRKAIAELPHDWKLVLMLHHFEQLSYREIGAIAGCAERGVETRLYRARQFLRARLRPLLEVVL